MTLPCRSTVCQDVYILVLFVITINFALQVQWHVLTTWLQLLVCQCQGWITLILFVAEHLLERVPFEDSEPVSVQGKLHKHAKFWLNDLEASSFVKYIVLYGYYIPFVVLPWPIFKCNHCSALEHEEFVTSAIDELVDTGCKYPVMSALWCVSPLSVVENPKGKLRFVLDLRYVNQFLPEKSSSMWV